MRQSLEVEESGEQDAYSRAQRTWNGPRGQVRGLPRARRLAVAGMPRASLRTAREQGYWPTNEKGTFTFVVPPELGNFQPWICPAMHGASVG